MSDKFATLCRELRLTLCLLAPAPGACPACAFKPEHARPASHACHTSHTATMPRPAGGYSKEVLGAIKHFTQLVQDTSELVGWLCLGLLLFVLEEVACPGCYS